MSERVGNERVGRLVVRTDVERPMAETTIILDFPVTKGLHDTAQVMTAVMSGADADLCDQFS
jgi:hypothetical protein